VNPTDAMRTARPTRLAATLAMSMVLATTSWAPSVGATSDDGFGPVATIYGPGDPLGLLHERQLFRTIAEGTDVVAVVRCTVPPNTSNTTYRKYLDLGSFTAAPTEVAGWLTTHVAPWFTQVSRQRMAITFRPAGTITLARGDGPAECLLKAQGATTAGDTNVVAYDSTMFTGGFGGPGRNLCYYSTGKCAMLAEIGRTPAESRRGTWVGGGAVGGQEVAGIYVAVHELGHTLGWPHSYRNPANEYENPWDVQSGTVPCVSAESSGVCLQNAQHTLAINRYAAGWIDPDDVEVLSRKQPGTTIVNLSAPLRRGNKMAVVRLTRDEFLTIEARPRRGLDAGLPHGGVAVHKIKVWPCDGPPSEANACPVATARQQMPLTADPLRGGHVLKTGDVRTFAKVEVAVVKRLKVGFRVRISI
jgi:hypothetical protein